MTSNDPQLQQLLDQAADFSGRLVRFMSEPADPRHDTTLTSLATALRAGIGQAQQQIEAARAGSIAAAEDADDRYAAECRGRQYAARRILHRILTALVEIETPEAYHARIKAKWDRIDALWEAADRVQRYATDPTAVRLDEAEQAQYVADLDLLAEHALRDAD